MNPLSTLRRFIQHFPALRRFVAFSVVPSGLFDSMILHYPISDEWKERVNLAREAPDNEFIPRVPDAGRILRGKQIMHNGLRINAGSYYGFEESILMHANRGVHEPQEERLFQEVLPHIESGSTMIEMGAFWSFYSMWFNKMVSGARNYMLEPDGFNLESGRLNFRLNGMFGEFRHCGIGEWSGTMPSGVPIVCVDDFVRTEGIAHVHLLHADIQGHEVAMLRGAALLFTNQLVDWVFVSTHEEKLHADCLALLAEYAYPIVAAVRPSESYSEDGVIVAKRRGIGGVERVDVALRSVPKAETGLDREKA
jgi:hypothetical protein